jgi:KaiC/GvpD/RAD55 family RecA-like ATPase
MSSKPLVATVGGSLEIAVEAVVALLRVLWVSAAHPVNWSAGRLRVIGLPEQLRIAAVMRPTVPDPVFDQMVRQLEGGEVPSADVFWFERDDLRFQNLTSRLIAAPVKAHDLRYLALRSVRRKFELRLGSAVLHQVQILTRTVRQLLDQAGESRSCLWSQVAAALGDSLAADGQAGVDLIQAFREAGLVLDVLAPAPQFSDFTVGEEFADSEYLLSHLFGLPTDIRGFDQLFGGGLMLADVISSPDVEAKRAGEPDAESIGARAVLTIGAFGSGKSLLSLQMAVEVARKGGVAWVMALEQSDEECRYSLESIGTSTRDGSFEIVRGPASAFLALTAPTPRSGCLIFLRPEPQGQPYRDFLDTIIKQLGWMRQYPLRLLVIDPVNAFVDGPGQSSGDTPLRTKTLELFEEAKKARVNVWLTSEQSEGEKNPDHFEENIADTVIHLGVERYQLQQQRYIEITKSRLQREQSGRHAMVIESGVGIRIDASSASMLRLLPRRVAGVESVPIYFGVPGMQELLGADEMRGDIIALAGPGEWKTFLGGQFLLGRGDNPGGIDPAKRQSVYVSDFSDDRMNSFLSRVLKEPGLPGGRTRRDIEICSLVPGYVDPGRVLQDIQDILEHCRAQGRPADRVLISNMARWEQEMPLVAQDSTFGVALISLLRQYMVTAVLICGDTATHGESRLRDIVFDNSDFLLYFSQVVSRGMEHTFVRAVKSKLMRHQRQAAEMIMDESGMRIEVAPLIRVSAAGDVTPVYIRLFLQAETTNHQQYNKRIEGALRTSVSPRTRIARQSENYDPTILAMSRLSAVDELQIIQLDEFQLPRYAHRPGDNDLLTYFPLDKWGHLLRDQLDDLVLAVTRPHDGQFIAVPFYENISVLVHRYGEPIPKSWEDLAQLCDEPGRLLQDDEAIFDCPIYADSLETYNCLFFEILQSIAPIPKDGYCDLLDLFSTGAALQAAVLFRRLCYRSHNMGYRKKAKLRASVSRHWYNTLNQELSDRAPGEASNVVVKAIYGDVTTAGEWYLAVPTYSASPEVGLEIIGNLTTPVREIERLQMGVGLPTRKTFYDGGQDAPSAISRYFRFDHEDLSRLVHKAFRRSRFFCYQQFAATISSHLLWLLEMPVPEKPGALQEGVRQAMASLVSNIGFLRKHLDCEKCRGHNRC